MLRTMICLLLLAGPALAETPVADPPAPGAARIPWTGGVARDAAPDKDAPDGAKAPAARKLPARFETDAAAVILGYGGPRGVDAKGIEAAIAVERASLRVRAMRRLMLADLDDDGAASRAELAVLMGAADAGGRARLWAAFGEADADGDGSVSAAEMHAAAAASAEAALARGSARQLRGLMALDADADGFVTLGELHDGMGRPSPKG